MLLINHVGKNNFTLDYFSQTIIELEIILPSYEVTINFVVFVCSFPNTDDSDNSNTPVTENGRG